MSNFTISVEVMAGTSVGDAVQEAKDMCIKLDVAYVMFRFNGVEFSVGKKAEPILAEQKLYDALEKGTNHKFVIMNGN